MPQSQGLGMCPSPRVWDIPIAGTEPSPSAQRGILSRDPKSQLCHAPPRAPNGSRAAGRAGMARAGIILPPHRSGSHWGKIPDAGSQGFLPLWIYGAGSSGTVLGTHQERRDRHFTPCWLWFLFILKMRIHFEQRGAVRRMKSPHTTSLLNPTPPQTPVPSSLENISITSMET